MGQNKSITRTKQFCYVFFIVLNQTIDFCNLNSLLSSNSSKTHHCCLAAASLFSNSPLSLFCPLPKTQKLHSFANFLQHPVAKCPCLYSVLGSTGLQRCALCWARELTALLPPAPPPLLLSPPPPPPASSQRHAGLHVTLQTLHPVRNQI